MKLIFSRKGFDSAAGGCPSPIVDGRPVSLPIPTRMPSAINFGDLAAPYGELVSDLTRGELAHDTPCHLDPDLDPGAIPRAKGWRGSLGQVAAAQSHLAGQGVGPGDLFIFWGLFRPVTRAGGSWKFSGPAEHRIWGWMQIDHIIDLGPDGSHALAERPWLADHPHVRPGWRNPNVLYIARERLKLDAPAPRLPGSGVLKRGRRLSVEGAVKSLWRVPDWLNPARGGSGMTYHPPERWSRQGTVQAASRGQEFIAAPTQQGAVHAWLLDLLLEQDA